MSARDRLRGLLSNPFTGFAPWIVLSHPNHVRAYLLMICIVLGMFTIVPHLATFLVINVGLGEANLSMMYLCGGLGTLMTMSLFGRLADRVGKLPVFRIMAGLTTVRPDGQPVSVPVWFLMRDDETILLYSQPGKNKLRNIASNPKVSGERRLMPGLLK